MQLNTIKTSAENSPIVYLMFFTIMSSLTLTHNYSTKISIFGFFSTTGKFNYIMFAKVISWWFLFYMFFLKLNIAKLCFHNVE